MKPYRVVVSLEQESERRGSCWFAAWDVYQGRTVVASGINAAYYRTPEAALRQAVRIIAVRPDPLKETL